MENTMNNNYKKADSKEYLVLNEKSKSSIRLKKVSISRLFNLYRIVSLKN